MAVPAIGRPGLDERQHGGPFSLRATLPMGGHDGQLDIDITHGPEPVPEHPQPGHVVADDWTLVGAAEDPPRGADPSSRDPHVVNGFGVLAGHRGRHARQHPREVEAEHLATGLGPGIGGGDLGRARDGEVLERELGDARAEDRPSVEAGAHGSKDPRRRVRSVHGIGCR